MTQNEHSWEIKPHIWPAALSIASGIVLTVAGVFLGGFLGALGAGFFGLTTAVSVWHLWRSRPVALFSAGGISLSPEVGATVFPWNEVAALLLWTRTREGASSEDRLSVVCLDEIDGLVLGDTVSLRNTASLRGCVVDVDDVRAALARLAVRVVVVDRRQGAVDAQPQLDGGGPASIRSIGARRQNVADGASAEPPDASPP